MLRRVFAKFFFEFVLNSWCGFHGFLASSRCPFAEGLMSFGGVSGELLMRFR